MNNAFSDIIVACGTGGVCFIKNDRAGLPFAGTVTVNAVAFGYDERVHAMFA